MSWRNQKHLLVNFQAECLEPIDTGRAQKARRKRRFIVIERLVKICVGAAALAVRGTRNRRKFGKHHASSVLRGETDRRFEVLFLGAGVPNDDVRSDGTGACLSQRAYGIRELLRIDFAAGPTLPLVNVGFESEEKGFKTGAHHEVCNVGCDKSRVQCIWSVK